MAQRFNPVTEQFETHHRRTSQPPSLLTSCRRAIQGAATIYRQSELKSLPLPPRLRTMVQTLEMTDFYIDPNDLKSTHHFHHSYPARCLLDNQPVTLKVTPRCEENDRPAPVSDPSYLTSFTCSNKTIQVCQPRTSLEELIAQHKTKGTKFQPRFVWNVIHGLTRTLQQGDAMSILKSDYVYCLENGTMLVEALPPSSHLFQKASDDFPIYASPEILMKQNADSRALSWIIGCIVYEMLALEPAYYLREGAPGGMFEVIMSVIQGKQPPVIDCNQGLKSLYQSCLCQLEERLSLEEVRAVAKRNCSTN